MNLAHLRAALRRAHPSGWEIVGRRLGVSVSSCAVHALLLDRGRITWAAAAEYASTDDLAVAIGHLAAECGRPMRRARVVLTRDVIQLRTLVPAPPLKPRVVPRYVALEAPRLFRRNGKPLVTDGRLVRVAPDQLVLWAAAAAEPLLRAVLSGCAEAGLDVEDIGPASEVLPLAVMGTAGTTTLLFPNGESSEVIEVGVGGAWHSRLVRGDEGRGKGEGWVPTLATLGQTAPAYAAAYAAAVGRPRLSLLPADTRAARLKKERRRVARLAAAAGVLWLLAGMTYVARLVATAQSAEAELRRLGPAVDSALAVRRDLAAAEATLAQIAEAEARRSRHLALLAELTRVLGDSVTVVVLRIGPDGAVRLAGYAPVAARALAVLENVHGLRQPRFEGPVARESRSGQREAWDRFAIVAHASPPGPLSATRRGGTP